MPLFHIVGFINCPKIVIVCLPRVRQRCLSMCVLNVFDFTNIKLHKSHINFLCFTWFIPSIQLPKKSISVSPQGKVIAQGLFSQTDCLDIILQNNRLSPNMSIMLQSRFVVRFIGFWFYHDIVLLPMIVTWLLCRPCLIMA